MGKISLTTLLAALFLMVPPARAQEALPPPQLAKFQADQGFIDDPLAVSDDGKELAYLTTDGSTKCELLLVKLAAPATLVSIPCQTFYAERIEFLDDARIMVFERDAATHLMSARIYASTHGDAAGAKDRLEPANEMALATVSGVPAIITYTKNPKAATLKHVFTAYRRDNLKLLATHTIVENPGGTMNIAGSMMKPLFFARGYTVLVARKPGRYDKKTDVRQPDMTAQVDLLTGKVIAEKEIGDLVAWTSTNELRRAHENQSNFLYVSENLKELRLLTSDDTSTVLALPRPLGKYELGSLTYQPCGEALCFSLTIDPVNPEAVAAKKADKDWIDFYRVDLKSHAVTELARIDGDKRGSRWQLGAGRLALLRKLKGFGRGGGSLEVFELFKK